MKPKAPDVDVSFFKLLPGSFELLSVFKSNDPPETEGQSVLPSPTAKLVLGTGTLTGFSKSNRFEEDVMTSFNITEESTAKGIEEL